MNRRQFLATAGTASAGLAGCLVPPSADREVDPWRYELDEFRQYTNPVVAADGVYAVSNARVHALGADGTERWDARTDRSFSGLLVAGKTVYQYYTSPTQPGYPDVIALDRRSGERRWEDSFPVTSRANLFAATEGLAFAGTWGVNDFEGERLFALDAATGEVAWRRTVDAWAAGLLVYRGTLYALFPDTLAAFDLTTGRRQWDSPYEHGGLRTPVMADDGRLYLQSDRLTAVDATDGRELWSYAPSRSDGRRLGIWTTVLAPRASPGSSRSGLHVGVEDGSVHAVAASDGRRVWRFDGPSDDDGAVTDLSVAGGTLACAVGDTLYCLDPGTGDLRWHVDRHGDSPQLGVAGGTVYALHRKRAGTREYTWAVTAFDAHSGARRWSFGVGGGIRRVAGRQGRRRPLLGLGGRAVVAAETGTLYALAPRGPPR